MDEKFLEEQKIIEKLKLKYEGEILVFTRKENKIKLIAHALFEKDLMDLIDNAFKDNKFNKGDIFFFR